MRDSARRRARVGEAGSGAPRLVSHDAIEAFRAVRVPVRIEAEEAVIAPEAAEVMRIVEAT